MIYDEKDIDFLKLSDSEFEEVCFELLIKLGFKGLVWRRGGSDSGRDIEGRFSVNNPLVESYDEKWFFECKRYKSGISPELLNSKIAWADAEKPKHLVIFVSSYITDGSRTWLDKISIEKYYSIHVIEGKRLKNLLLRFSDIVTKYFVDQYLKLLAEARNNWLVHDILPDPDTLSLLSNQLDPSKLEPSELGFLLCAVKNKSGEIDEWILENEPFSVDHLFYHLTNNANCSGPVLSTDTDFEQITATSGSCDWEITYPIYTIARLTVKTSETSRPALYSFVRDSEGEGIEVLIEATSDFPTKIRHLPTNARKEEQKTFELLLSRRKKL